ncbi:SDR family oxidoreductase [Edaphobacter flagellatus]|uniref:SDR family oxidoreductase n=1 Tax=Edaphobacter flagellatus TaxID=1933044 RepID=UPI0021B2DDCA|nr:SDR family oxidoreductase [Edaphobacter flagellatus]
MSTAKKVALISGANKGIGLETARQLGRQGITVILGARDLAKGEAAAEQLKKEGIDASAIRFDVVNEADIKAAVDKIEKDYGKLDILINNAGVMLEPIGGNNTTTVSEDILRKTFETNFFSAIAVTNAFLPLLKKSEAGRIVNVSSILGSLTLHAAEGSPIYEAKALAYDSSKTALNAYTIHLAHALKGTKIKVNSAHPGWVKTDMGTDAAPMDVVDGAKTEVELATLGPDGPTGGYFHLGEALSW